MATASSSPAIAGLDQYDLTGKVGGYLDRHLLLRALEFLEDNQVFELYFVYLVASGSF